MHGINKGFFQEKIPEEIDGIMIIEEEYLLLLSDKGFTTDKLRIMREYIYQLSATTCERYSVVADREGYHLAIGILRNDEDHLKAAGLILEPGEDTFEKMQENIDKLKMMREYIRRLSDRCKHYGFVSDKKGDHLAYGILRNDDDHLKAAGLILEPGEDAFEKMLEIMDDLDKEDNGGRNR
ncbi:MAG: hypothetical protein AB7F25_12390 [Deferribacterales bacterium]